MVQKKIFGLNVGTKIMYQKRTDTSPNPNHPRGVRKGTMHKGTIAMKWNDCHEVFRSTNFYTNPTYHPPEDHHEHPHRMDACMCGITTQGMLCGMTAL